MIETWTVYIFPCTVLICFAALYFIVKNLLPTYFGEKGKNLATKQDISTITHLVEEVKDSFIRETERLKANLQLNNSLQIGLALEERNAVLGYYEKYRSWVNAMTDSSLGGINIFDNVEIDKYLFQLNQLYRELQDKEARFDLLVEDDGLSIELSLLSQQTLSHLGGHIETAAYKIKLVNFEIESMKKITPIQDQSVKYGELLKKISLERDEMRAKIIEGYKVVSPLSKKFELNCRNYLYKLIQKEELKYTNL